MRRSTTSASGSAGATNDADAAHLKDQSRVSGIGMTSARTRERLVARLREQGITDNEVLERIRSVPRHMFVDEALASRAYEDTALPIGHGQTISQPYIVARMTQSLLEARQAAQGARGRHGLRLPDRGARAAGRDALQRRAHRGAAGEGAADPARPAHRERVHEARRRLRRLGRLRAVRRHHRRRRRRMPCRPRCSSNWPTAAGS